MEIIRQDIDTQKVGALFESILCVVDFSLLVHMRYLTICWSEWLLCGALGLKKKTRSLVIYIRTKTSPFCGISKRVKSTVIIASIFQSSFQWEITCLLKEGCCKVFLPAGTRGSLSLWIWSHALNSCCVYFQLCSRSV